MPATLPPPVRVPGHADRSGPPPDLRAAEQAYRHAGEVFRWGGIVARASGYTLLWAIGTRYAFGHQFLAGVLLGDFLVWAVATVLDWRDLEPFVRIEAIAFTVFLLWTWQHWSWPPQPELQAIFGLAAFAALVGRVGALSSRRLGGCGDDGW